MNYKVLLNVTHDGHAYKKDEVVDASVFGDSVDRLVESNVIAPADQVAEAPSQEVAEAEAPLEPTPETPAETEQQPTAEQIAQDLNLEDGQSDDSQPIPVQ